MAMVVKVHFKRAAKFYDFSPNGLELHTGMKVITETVRGVEMGECMSGVIELPDEGAALPLKPILRVATEADLATQRQNEKREKEAFAIAEQRILEHKLEMKLVDVEYAFDHSKITFYFTANGRVDFRNLVKSLAAVFKTRIELRQIGVRDEAKLLGGIGPCGRPICCATFLGELSPVTIKMAKEQNLSLNPTKISGLCDKLMCCLKYEQDHYEATRKRLPRTGKEILTPDGPGTVSAVNALSETVRVRIAVGDSFELRQYSIDECTRPERPEEPKQESAPQPEKKKPAERPKRAVAPPRQSAGRVRKKPQQGEPRQEKAGPKAPEEKE